MSVQFYLFLHLFGLVLTVFSFAYAVAGVATDYKQFVAKRRRLTLLLSGLGLLILLVGGFGMLAKLEYAFPWPGWIWIKLLVWVSLPIFTSLVLRIPSQLKLFSILGAIWVIVAIYLGVYRPF